MVMCLSYVENSPSRIIRKAIANQQIVLKKNTDLVQSWESYSFRCHLLQFQVNLGLKFPVGSTVHWGTGAFFK